VASEPPQSFSAGFTLSGNADAGELSLTSPLGSILAVMHWQPGQATLRQGEQTSHFDSVETLAAQATGAPIPVRALFGWLRGQPENFTGWQANLSQLESGRISALRQMPLPAAELRIILDL
jgi:outer membrane lipoprotein LolB